MEDDFVLNIVARKPSNKTSTNPQNSITSTKREKREKYLISKSKKIQKQQNPNTFEQQGIPSKSQLVPNSQNNNKVPQRSRDKPTHKKKISKPKTDEKSIFDFEPLNPDAVFSVKRYEEIDIDERIKTSLRHNKYEKQTNIQSLAFETVSNKVNCLIKSETGSGKTLAYLVPVVNYLVKEQHNIDRSTGLLVLIICPNRELTQQITDEAKKVMKFLISIVPGALSGGENIKKEKSRIRKGINILCCTPGRLNYHLQHTESLKIENIRTIVFEEFDQILDMGFKNEVENFYQTLKQKIPDFQQKVHKILVSSTLTIKVQSFSKIFETTFKVIGENAVDLAKKLEVKNEEDSGDEKKDKVVDFQIPNNIKQTYLLIHESQKLAMLVSFILRYYPAKIIVFCLTQDEVEFIQMLLQNLHLHRTDEIEETQTISLSTFKLHGKMEQKDRKLVFKQFVDCKQGVLLATDVASRGLDFHNVNYIIQFDPPNELSDYVNRVGRTGRLDQKGYTVMFLLDKEKQYIKYLTTKGAIIEELSEDEILGGLIHKFINEYDLNINNNMDVLAIIIHSLKKVISNDRNMESLGKKSVMSFLNAYSRLKLKEYFYLGNIRKSQLVRAFGGKDMKDTIDDSAKPFKQEKIRLRKNKFTTEAGNNKIREKFSVYNLSNEEFM